MDASLTITSATVFMAALGGLLAVLLVLANKRLYVYEDPRIEEVENLLPSANCGACGQPGCHAFAEGLVEGKFSPSQCTANSADMNGLIATTLGVGMGSQEKKLARLACAGGNHVAWQRARYKGLDGCRAADIVAGGGKGCSWGCLGMADCSHACTFDAIYMDDNGLPVVDEEKCTGCGDCVDACPRNLFSIHPESHKLWVACKNLEHGEAAEADCDVACNACTRCVADAPAGAIAMTHNLATIDYSKNDKLTRAATERCPTGAIVWLEKGKVKKGEAARKVLRKDALPVA